MCDWGTHKTRRVVIPDGLGISKGLQNRISLNYLLLQVGLHATHTHTHTHT